MREAANDIRGGNSNNRQIYIGHLDLCSGSRILLSEIVVVRTSKKYLNMNTFPPEQRVRMLRPTSVLQTTNTFQKGLLDRYEQRPDSYGGLCLAGFAANFEFSKSRARTRQGASSDNKAEEENYILEVYFALRDVSGFIRERNRPSVFKISLK